MLMSKIKKWGNSQGVRIPKNILDKVSLNENDSIEITVKDNGIFIKGTKKHRTLKERFSNYDGKYKVSEFDTGKTVGKEVF